MRMSFISREKEFSEVRDSPGETPRMGSRRSFALGLATEIMYLVIAVLIGLALTLLLIIMPVSG